MDASVDPRTGEAGRSFAWTSDVEVDSTMTRAAAARRSVADALPGERAEWLRALAEGMRSRAHELVDIGVRETGLAADALAGEVEYAAHNLEYYASIAEQVRFRGERSDTGPPPGIRVRESIPLGVVLVFGASNFPLGFGVLGHDTASAIAAGCPVVAKLHPAHPELSTLLAEIAADALTAAGAPAGVFGCVRGFQPGLQLLDHPEAAAVAFTGSTRGGLAIAERCQPRGIPVFAEMGTVNPVLVDVSWPRSEDPALIAEFVSCLTDRAGQFCTKPGMLLIPRARFDGSGLIDELARVRSEPLLTSDIAARYRSTVGALARNGHRLLTGAPAVEAGSHVRATVLVTDAEGFLDTPELLEECFGPFGIVCLYETRDDVDRVLHRLQPCLAFSVFADPESSVDGLRALARAGARKAGRVVFNAWPTGIPISFAQHHGGPWPAASRADATSVGAAALERFVRPVTFQDWPPRIGSPLARTETTA